jgi:signal transduction histidine kinase
VSLQARVVRLSAGLVAAALALAGVVTGALIHARAVAALDNELLAAAHAYAPAVATWRVEHGESRVRVWLAETDGAPAPDDATTEGVFRVAAPDVARALHTERPVYADVQAHRVLLLVVERPLAPHEPRVRDAVRPEEADEAHLVVAAAARRPGPMETIGPFLLPFLAASALVVGLAVAVGRRLAGLALAPLDAARRAAEQATGVGAAALLPEEGPNEIRALLGAINTLLQRLDAAASAQARFTAEAAHELRTPVTVLLGELDVTLRRERSPAELREALVSAREEAARLAALVDGLLALARVDAGAVESGWDETDARQVVAEAVHRERAALDRAGCALAVDVPEGLAVRGNVPLLVTALATLLRNAAVHAPGAPVRLSVESSEAGVRFRVHDGGPGIPQADRELVFDRLARGGRARRKDQAGLGLGLPLAREIARRHGGDCTVRGGVERGCEVVLEVGRGK